MFATIIPLGARFGFAEPAAAEALRWNIGQVGLNIENRRVVEHVDTPHGEHRAFSLQQLDDGQADRIWASRRPCREDPMRAIVAGGCSDEGDFFGAVKRPDDNQVRKPLDIGEAGFQFGSDLERALGLVVRAETLRDLLGVAERAADVADGAHGEDVGAAHGFYASARGTIANQEGGVWKR